jgi:hypothetical protein
LDISSAYETAVELTRAGYRVVPIPFRSKNPGLNGWNKLRLDEGDLPNYFKGTPQNIGMLLGEPSGWVVDVDLDHARAIQLADAFLPPTRAIFGRPGKPRSHWLYRATRPVKSKQWATCNPLEKKQSIVELRSTGLQTVVPPSTHESGEPIRWELAEWQPAVIDPDELMSALELLVVAVGEPLKAAAVPNRRYGKQPGGKSRAADHCYEKCLEAMKRIRPRDGKDGSRRLLAAACRAVEWELSDAQALACIREYGHLAPFPRRWTDDEILRRIRSAEKKCTRGARLAKQQRARAGPSQATSLVKQCDQVEVFHDDNVGYATVPAGNHRETLPIRGREFKRWLSRSYYLAERAVPSGQALLDAINVLDGKALFEGDQIRVHVRLAEQDGATYIDLADEERRIVRVAEAGWEIVAAAPVRFRRPRGMRALPLPIAGGSLLALREFINLERDDDFILLIAWLVGTYRVGRPCPVLAFHSEQGSGKSTASRILRLLIDPNAAPIRAEPRDVRDLMIAASNSLIVALDNLSRVSDWLSDAICRLSTGGGFGTRVLFENDEEAIFDALRPVIINGIEELGTRSDLLDRTIRLNLPSIPEEMRQPEELIYSRFEKARPQILGALLTALSTAIHRLDGIRLDRLPRMADFARWVVAAEPALGCESGSFMRAYATNRASAHELALESTAIGQAIQLFAERHGEWTGRSTELLTALNEVADEPTRKQKGWPTQPHILSGILRRIAPNLRTVGVLVEFPQRSRDGRAITIRQARGSVTSVTERHGCHLEAASDWSDAGRDAHGKERNAPPDPGDARVSLAGYAQTLVVSQRDACDAPAQQPHFGRGDERNACAAIVECKQGYDPLLTESCGDNVR